MTEIQGKSILVRVSARFELARVRVIGSQLYYRSLLLSTRKVDYWTTSTSPHFKLWFWFLKLIVKVLANITYIHCGMILQ